MAHAEAFRWKREPRFAGHQLSILHLYEEVAGFTGPSLLGKHDDSLQVFVLWTSSLVEVKALLLWRERQKQLVTRQKPGTTQQVKDLTWGHGLEWLESWESENQGRDPNFKTKPQKWALLQKPTPTIIHNSFKQFPKRDNALKGRVKKAHFG